MFEVRRLAPPEHSPRVPLAGAIVRGQRDTPIEPGELPCGFLTFF
jgi:hypothetical protein